MAVHVGGHRWDVIVLGAGAAGLMAAAEAGKRGRRVVVLDPGERPGRKILISGGGRCNFTNLRTQAENFVSQNPHFARSALAGYSPQDFLQMVERHGIPWHEKILGQLFCNDTAKRIVTLLERECGEAGVEIRCGVRPFAVRRLAEPEASGFAVNTSTGTVTASSVVVATGGLSIPKLGATGFGYEVARQFGHEIVEPRPALVPLVLSPEDTADWCDLTGLSTLVTAGVNERGAARGGRSPRTPRFREKLLITHRGISGPAVLQISTYWHGAADLHVDLVPETEVLAPLLARNARRDRAALVAALRVHLPGRLAERWAELHLSRGADWTNHGLQQAEAALHQWTLRPSGTEGYGKAEVTAGGVHTDGLDARTLQSRRTPGLFFVGEVVDVTGWLGGYNFQWAWASGAAAGRAA